MSRAAPVARFPGTNKTRAIIRTEACHLNLDLFRSRGSKTLASAFEQA